MTHIPLNLFSPPAAQTENTAAILWDKPECGEKIDCYQIYVDGVLNATSDSTDFTITNLKPKTSYEVYVCAVVLGGTIAIKSNSIIVTTKEVAVIFDVTQYGAVGDGKTVNTNAIQTAIDACTIGGMVYIPSGVFVSGAIYLKSDMTLCLHDDAILIGSDNVCDFPIRKYRFEGLETDCYASLINTKFNDNKIMKNITICGKGTIDANGMILRKQQVAENNGKPGRAICIINTDSVYLKDITVRQSPAWCVHMIYCSNISINNVSIHTRCDANGNRYSNICNGDGFDPDSCKNVYVFDCMIASQDDCIAIKSGRNEEGRSVGISSENIRITNCRFNSGFGVAVGSEMSGDVRGVFVQDCIFDDAYSIASIKCPRGRGGIIENIVYSDCTLKNHNLEHHDCEWFRGGIYIDEFYSHIAFDANESQVFDETTPTIRNITFRNLTVDTITGNAIYLTGLPESPLENISLENITAVGKYGMKANNIRGLIMKNVSVTSKEDEDYLYCNVKIK